MATRKRYPERERERAKKQYEKLKIKLAADPEFAEEFRRKRREQQRNRKERIKSDPVKYQKFLEQEKEANIKYGKKKWENKKNKMQSDPEYKAKVQMQKRKGEQKRMEKLKADPEKLAVFKEQCRQAMERFKVNSPEKYKASYTKRNQEKSKLQRVLNRMKTIEIQDKKPSTIEPERKTHPKPTKPVQRKEDAFRDYQLKKCNLERLITIPEIREEKLNYLQNQFVSQYGAMPI